MRKFLFVMMLAVSLSLAAIARQGSADPKAHAQEVIKQAQAALWGDGKSKVQSLSITGTDRLNMAGLMGGRGAGGGRGGGGDTRGGGDARGGGARGGGRGGNGDTLSEITLDILLPDKFLQTSVRSMGPASMTSLFAINGTQTWTDAKSSNPVSMGGGGGDGGFGGGGGGGDVGGGGGAPPPPPPGGGDMGRGGGQDGAGGPGGNQRMMGMPGQAQAPDFGRLMFALLLTTPATLPLEFTYAGEAKTPDGKTMDVLDATGPNNFTTRLFFSQQTHQLLIMSYKGRAMGRGPGGPGGGPGGQGGQGGGQGNRNAGGGGAAENETRWDLTDYRNDGGLTFPHLIVKSTMGQTGSQPYGEVEIKKVKVNPSLKPEKFEKKEEKK